MVESLRRVASALLIIGLFATVISFAGLYSGGACNSSGQCAASLMGASNIDMDALFTRTAQSTDREVPASTSYTTYILTSMAVAPISTYLMLGALFVLIVLEMVEVKYTRLLIKRKR